MNVHAKSAIAILLLGVIGIVAFKFGWPMVQERLQLETSDARDTKVKMVIGVDNWIGYFVLCSAELKQRMRAGGYRVECLDDKADYAGRMQRLKDGELQLAVATVDSYVLNGAPKGFPATIIAVLDESKGGDAIVAWKDRAATVEDLKKRADLKVAFTPSSPSEHLLKAMAVHFDIAALRQRRGPWRIEATGSEDALDKLLGKKVDAAVLWEPDVTRALATPGIVKLLGTEDTDKLIVDVLLVNRKFSQEHPEAVVALLSSYFEVLKLYRENAPRLEVDVVGSTRIPHDKVKAMLNGVAWVGLSENVQSWLGGRGGIDGLVDAVQSTVKILVESGDFKDNPIPDQDPYRIINRQFVSGLYVNTVTGAQGVDAGATQSLRRPFKALTDAEWDALKEVGTLKTLPVVFQSGTADLGLEGKEELDKAMENLKPYGNFRVVVKGHTGLKGSPEENRKLSQERAEAVARYLEVTYNIDHNRLRTVGFGSDKPLPQLADESERAYGYRLPRVELSLVADIP